MLDPKISLYSPSIRPCLWKGFFSCLSVNDIAFEVVFCGPCEETPEEMGLPENFRYIKTKNVKMVQCIEIALRHTKAPLIMLSADDLYYHPYALDQVYDLYNKVDSKKAVISFSVVDVDKMHNHSLKYPGLGEIIDHSTGRVADIVEEDRVIIARSSALWNRDFFISLGGYDKGFVSGQMDIDVALRARLKGALFHQSEVVVEESSPSSPGMFHIACNNYYIDRDYLSFLWLTLEGKVRKQRKQPFSPFIFDDSIYEVSQGTLDPKGNHV